MSALPVESPVRQLRLMGDNLHGEKTVATTNNEWGVDNSPPDLTVSYRQTYITGVYADPNAAEVADTSSLIGFETSPAPIEVLGCPCASTGL